MGDNDKRDFLQDMIVLSSIEHWDRLRITRAGRLEKECRSFQGTRRTLSGDGRQQLCTHLTNMLSYLLQPGADTTLHLHFNDVREGVARLRVTTYNDDTTMQRHLQLIENNLSKAYANKTRPAYRSALLKLGIS